MKFVHTQEGLTFVWEGGEYIEIYWQDAYAIRGDQGDNPAVPFAVDNVWGNGAPAIERTQEAFLAACAEWLTNNREDLNAHLEYGS